jgi:sialic acid synthase SpsE
VCSVGAVEYYYTTVSHAEFVAEVSSNHHRDLNRCLAFIDRAASIGSSAVKFQLFRIADLFAPEALAYQTELRQREAWELPVEFLPALADRCRQRGVRFGCTPFYVEAVDTLVPHVDFFKIASYELLWADLLTRCAGSGKPVVLATGMATLDEITHAADTLRRAGCRDLTLLHCISGYPAPAGESNLAAIQTMAQACGCPVGWSDHSVSPAVIYRAIHRWGASMIEYHLDLDGTGDEFATGHCWLPDQMREVIATVRAGEMADGSGEKVPAPSERRDREWRADPVDGLRPLRATREGLVR